MKNLRFAALAITEPNHKKMDVKYETLIYTAFGFILSKIYVQEDNLYKAWFD